MARRPDSKLPEFAPADPDEVRAQLERVISSQPFRTSKRCSDFLRYVTEATVEGRTDTLKERGLGVAVFERAPDYDTSQDPIVRNTAGQVRRRLAQYYQHHSNRDEIRIDLPSGSYVPEFSAPAVPAGTVVLPNPAALGVHTPKRWPWIVAAIAVLACAAFYFRPKPGNPVDQFWAPIVKHAGAVVLCVGQGHTYKLTGDWDRRFEEGRPSGSVPVEQVVPAWDRYVGLTDVQALTRLTALFTRYGKEVELKGGRNTSLTDLRRRTVVLVGAFNNEWTLSLTGELRFYFESDPANRLDMVLDRRNPGQREWTVRSDLSSTQISMDYAIVTRVNNPTTEQIVVVVAGIKGGGTIAAAEFLINPVYLEKALQNAPSDGRGKNLQFVLATKMFSGTPGPPSVVAAHYW
jgi:hypothetical protein